MPEHKCTEESRIKRNEKDIVLLYKKVDRPPIWATFLIAGLSSLASVATTVAVMAQP